MLLKKYDIRSCGSSYTYRHCCGNDEMFSFISFFIPFDNFSVNILNYVWKTGDSVAWLLDKKIKSDTIIFNADAEDNTITGYLSAQSKSYYFGTLKDLHLANDRAIYSTEDVLTLLETMVKKHE